MANSVYILGINGGVRPGYQDISAVLLCNGEIVAAIEEERINRIKHSAGQLPIESIRHVLAIAEISIKQVNVVAFHGSTWQNSIEDVIKQHFENYFGYCPPVKRFHHHSCHAASAFYASGYDKALIFTIDGSGDGISTRISLGSDNGIEVLEEFERPQSLGIFYTLITQFCGFTRDSDEYKLMGLAAYGNPDKYNFDWLLKKSDKAYYLDTNYLLGIAHGQPAPSRYEMQFNSKFINKIGFPRRTEKIISDEYKNIAAAAQLKLELIIEDLVESYIRKTGIRTVCFAGGVALNCVVNKRIEALQSVDKLFVQPASGDSGISLGAAYLAAKELYFSPNVIEHVYFGNEFTDEEIEQDLINCGVNYYRSQNIIDEAAESLAQNKVVGWFQGRMEFGPRALGNRSILANPTAENIKSIVNQKIKFRESFRPFGASVLKEDFHLHFEAKCEEAPFMTKVFNVKTKWQNLLKGVTHADGTCRVQTVKSTQNEQFYNLLLAFKKQTGTGVLLNTSFNLSHEPIVFTPRQAIASFFSSGMEQLYIGNFIVEK